MARASVSEPWCFLPFRCDYLSWVMTFPSISRYTVTKSQIPKIILSHLKWVFWVVLGLKYNFGENLRLENLKGRYKILL